MSTIIFSVTFQYDNIQYSVWFNTIILLLNVSLVLPSFQVPEHLPTIIQPPLPVLSARHLLPLQGWTPSTQMPQLDRDFMIIYFKDEISCSFLILVDANCWTQLYLSDDFAHSNLRGLKKTPNNTVHGTIPPPPILLHYNCSKKAKNKLKGGGGRSSRTRITAPSRSGRLSSGQATPRGCGRSRRARSRPVAGRRCRAPPGREREARRRIKGLSAACEAVVRIKMVCSALLSCLGGGSEGWEAGARRAGLPRCAPAQPASCHSSGPAWAVVLQKTHTYTGT